MLFLYNKMEMLKARVRDDAEGATAVEYGLLVALIAVVIIGSVIALGGTLDGVFSDVESQIGGATTP